MVNLWLDTAFIAGKDVINIEYRLKRHITSTLLYAVIMIITIVIADVIIDALTPSHSLAFLYRLIANICIVIGYAIAYFKYKKKL